MLTITPSLSIPDNEIKFLTCRSSGPGGQHVNKTSTKVVLVFNIDNSESLTAAQRKKIRIFLKNKINKNGELVLSCEENRSQFKNKEQVVDKFKRLIALSLKPLKKRKPTKIPYTQKQKRINNKSKRAELKKNRSKPMY